MGIPAAVTAVPGVPPVAVARPRLTALLDGAPGGLVTVIAPTGYGKTVLLAQWLRGPGGPRPAWVSLDATFDADRFRTAVEAATGLRLDALAAGPAGVRPVRLVLDDLQELTDPEALRELDRLLRARPPGLQLVLAGRRDPVYPVSAPLSVERSGGLRADDLRFTAADTEALLRALGLDLAPAQRAALCRRTGGWAAGLRLAASALRASGDREGFVERFCESEQPVADYLVGEVVAGLGARARVLLRLGSVCSLLPTGLAVALTGQPDAGCALHGLGTRTGLVERLDDTTHRVHALLRSYLVTDLRGRPDRFRRAHVAAADWWLAAGDPGHALHHVERAGDPETAARLLPVLGLRLATTGRFAALRRLLAATRGAHPEPPWVPLLAALPALFDGSDRAAAEVLELLPHLPGGPELEPVAELSRTTVRSPDRARATLHLLVRAAREGGACAVEVGAWQRLALVELAAGRYGPMRDAACAARAALVPGGPAGALAAVVAGYADLLAGDPLAARGPLAAALDGLPGGDPERMLRVLYAVACDDLGEPAAGRGRAALVELEAPRVVLAALAVLDHRVGPAHSGRLTDRIRDRLGEGAESSLLEAWTHQAAGRHVEARRAAAAALTERALVAHTAVEAHLVLAECALQGGDTGRARAEATAAVDGSVRLDVVRPAARAVGPVGELVEEAAAAERRWHERLVLARTVLLGRAPTVLSDRQLAVLALLPTLLSAAEIADELVVSVNTVKTHLRAIYAKLGVGTRRDAVARAREEGLFTSAG